MEIRIIEKWWWIVYAIATCVRIRIVSGSTDALTHLSRAKLLMSGFSRILYTLDRFAERSRIDERAN